MRVANGTMGCSFWYPVKQSATTGERFRFRYFAHDCKECQIIFCRPEMRKKHMFSNFVNDKWTWGSMTTEQAGFEGSMEHFEIIASSKGPEAYLLVDKIVWDKK